jgi:hypothetical protein
MLLLARWFSNWLIGTPFIPDGGKPPPRKIAVMVTANRTRRAAKSDQNSTVMGQRQPHILRTQSGIHTSHARHVNVPRVHRVVHVATGKVISTTSAQNRGDGDSQQNTQGSQVGPELHGDGSTTAGGRLGLNGTVLSLRLFCGRGLPDSPSSIESSKEPQRAAKMSGMRLRDSIRAPQRYGEDEYETPSRVWCA